MSVRLSSLLRLQFLYSFLMKFCKAVRCPKTKNEFVRVQNPMILSLCPPVFQWESPNNTAAEPDGLMRRIAAQTHGLYTPEVEKSICGLYITPYFAHYNTKMGFSTFSVGIYSAKCLTHVSVTKRERTMVSKESIYGESNGYVHGR